MESPFNRPVAANLIMKAIDQHFDSLIKDQIEGNFRCGFSLEMQVYTALRLAGYLTEEAMVRDEN